MSLFFSKTVLLLSILLSVACGQDKTDVISQEELFARLNGTGTPQIIDVRTADEFNSGHIPKAVNIPHTEFEKNFEQLQLKPSDEVVIYCESGRRAGIVKSILKEKGFYEVRHLTGDMKGWREAKLPCEDC